MQEIIVCEKKIVKKSHFYVIYAKIAIFITMLVQFFIAILRFCKKITIYRHFSWFLERKQHLLKVFLHKNHYFLHKNCDKLQFLSHFCNFLYKCKGLLWFDKTLFSCNKFAKIRENREMQKLSHMLTCSTLF